MCSYITCVDFCTVREIFPVLETSFFLTWRPPSHPAVFAQINRNAKWLKFTCGFEPPHPSDHSWAQYLGIHSFELIQSKFFFLFVFSWEWMSGSSFCPWERCPCLQPHIALQCSVFTLFNNSRKVAYFSPLVITSESVDFCVAFMTSGHYSCNKRGISAWIDTVFILCGGKKGNYKGGFWAAYDPSATA